MNINAIYDNEKKQTAFVPWNKNNKKYQKN